MALEVSKSRPVILFDGVCGLCNAFNRFVLRHDTTDCFRFAPLQGGFARAALLRHGIDALDLETVYVLTAPGTDSEAVIARAKAVAFVLKQMPGTVRLGRLLSALPQPLADITYSFVASHRYRLFGKLPTCALLTPEQRTKFLDN
jgi:predicted DCC family thiol-disulfide oxidoreductase YuxK